jgi:hypothetical protein
MVSGVHVEALHSSHPCVVANEFALNKINREGKWKFGG